MAKLSIGKMDDDYSAYSCKYDADKVMEVFELMNDEKKWPQIKKHLQKKKEAMDDLDDMLIRVEKESV